MHISTHKFSFPFPPLIRLSQNCNLSLWKTLLGHWRCTVQCCRGSGRTARAVKPNQLITDSTVWLSLMASLRETDTAPLFCSSVSLEVLKSCPFNFISTPWKLLSFLYQSQTPNIVEGILDCCEPKMSVLQLRLPRYCWEILVVPSASSASSATRICNSFIDIFGTGIRPKQM